MNLTDSERIHLIEAYAGLSTNALGKYIGMKTSQTLYDIHNGKHSISRSLARVLSDKFEGLSMSWILTGEGDMLLPDPENSDDTPPAIIDAGKDVESVSIDKKAYDLIFMQQEIIKTQQATIAFLTKHCNDKYNKA